MTEKPATQQYLEKRKPLYWFISFLLVIGILLSILSWLRICKEGCSVSHNYRFFGMHFEPIGLLFFISALLLHYYTKIYPLLSIAVGLMLAGALGAEIVFVYIQKYVIERWCPICLSIAGTVALAFIANMVFSIKNIRNYYKQEHKVLFMKNIWYSLSSFSILAIGIVIALFGVAKPDNSFAAATKVGSNTTPLFGNTSSNVQVYVVTDWFCPACRQIETKVLYNLYPEIMKKATLIFVDRAIHEDSLNFTPYNLSFMINQKDKYFKIRKALHDLSEETRRPTDAQIAKAVAPLGVTYKRLEYSDINSGIQYFDGISREFKIDSTPTVIITNRRNLNAKVLVGGGEITKDNIMDMINELAKK